MDCATVFKCAKCLVEPSGADGWVANTEGGEAGPYLSRDIALRVAVADVKAFRKSGRSVRLVVKDEARRVCAERCLCVHATR
jgi:hypothetical protein